MITKWLYNIFLRPFYYRLTGKGKPTFTNKLKYLSKYAIGDWTYGAPVVREWREGSTLEIGKFCSIAGGVFIFLGGEHHFEWISQYPFSHYMVDDNSLPNCVKSKGNVVIGNDVWIGHDALILSGVVIGNGAVIGARSVITKDVPAYAVVAGNPARVIKFRFAHNIIELLEKIKWWDWNEQEIIKALPLLLSDNIVEFVNKYKF